MAFYLGHIKGWDPEIFKFYPVQTFDALKEGVRNDDFDFFMWEHFTTKPSVDRYYFSFHHFLHKMQ